MAPVLHQLLSFPPPEAGGGLAAASAGIAVAGAGLWMVGARFSQALVTLSAVSAGALVGLSLPRWFGWPVASWATASGGALVLGVLGYMGYRMWVVAGLCLLVAAWTAVAVAMFHGVTSAEALPPRPEGTSLNDYAGSVYRMLPELRRRGSTGRPWSNCVLTLLAAGILGYRKPLLAGYAFYSLLGVTLAAIFGVLAMELGRPQMLQTIPSGRGTQGMVLAALVIFGILVQWRLSPRGAALPALRQKQDET